MNNLLKKEGGIWKYNIDELKEYIEDESKKCDGKLDLCKHLGVNKYFLNNLERKYNISFKYNFNTDKEFSKYYKAEYQDYDWCYNKFFIEGLNHEEMAKEAKCSKRVIEKWCYEKHGLTQKFRQHNKELNNIQRDLIIGSLLGDGHIDKRETQPLFIVSHAENQKEYLYWKYELLKDLCNRSPLYIKPQDKLFGDKLYSCQAQYRLCTRIYDCLKEYRSMSKRELINNLNQFSLSIFALDDGYRAYSKWQICLADIDIEDRILFVDNLKNEFGLVGTICNYDNRYVNLDSHSSIKLDDIILSNIPNDLDIIKYKILEHNKKRCVK